MRYNVKKMLNHRKVSTPYRIEPNLKAFPALDYNREQYLTHTRFIAGKKGKFYVFWYDTIPFALCYHKTEHGRLLKKWET